jgi:Ca2+-binding RTX toxin-like protein
MQQAPSVIAGTAADDRLDGTAAADHISGLAGDDTLRGGLGDDTLQGDEGNDDIEGGAGADVVSGGAGSNVLDGGSDPGDTLDYSWLAAGAFVRLGLGVASGPGFSDQITGFLRVIGGAGNDTLIGSRDDDTLVGGLMSDLLSGGAGADRLSGGPGDNTLNGGGDSLFDTADYRWTVASPDGTGISADLAAGQASGSDFTDVLLGIRVVEGGLGNDTLAGNIAANTLAGFDGADVLRGAGGNDVLLGGEGDDQLDGEAGLDTLQGGLGNNTLSGGGSALDTVDYSWALAGVQLSLAAGTASGSGFSDTLTGLPSAIGSDFADRLLGGATANTLRGAGGNDTLLGLGGNDALYGDAGDDSLAGGAGNDLLEGGDGNDVLLGGAGEDVFSGGLGNNTLTGGGGLQDTADYDWQQLAIEADLAAGVVRGTGFSDILTGVNSIEAGAGNDTLSGGSASEELSGADGDDLISGGAGDDKLQGDQGNDTLSGDAGDDELEGGDGDDLLDGGEGDDTLSGGAGLNTLAGGAGFDTIDYSDTLSAIVVDLSANSVQGEGITDQLSGFEAVLLGRGNDTVIGGGVSYRDAEAGVSIDLSRQDAQSAGSYGFDTLLNVLALQGSGLDDVLLGNDGDNRIDGFLGADQMEGGAGNDYYFVDNVSDQVIETDPAPDAVPVRRVAQEPDPDATPGSNIDTVESTVSYALSTGIENLVLALASGARAGIGNTLDNAITGNEFNNTLTGFEGNDTLTGGAGNDTLVGGAGVDSMVGGAGNDTYVVDSATEALIGNALLVERVGEGADTVQTAVSLRLAANFEHLVLTGSGAIAGVGNALANTITGNAGANLLRGLAGNDTLQGGAGADRFQFETNLNEATNVDTLRDFASGTDRIVLDDDVFRSFSSGASTRLGDGQFVTGTGSVTAADENDFLLYDTSDGVLYYDRDGSGPAAALKFAVLEGAPALVAADFLIVG